MSMDSLQTSIESETFFSPIFCLPEKGKAMSDEEKATDRWENEGGHG
jgi:hypothetical protein